MIHAYYARTLRAPLDCSFRVPPRASYFDGIFLLKEIIPITGSNNVKPVIRDGRIINLKVEFGLNEINITLNLETLIYYQQPLSFRAVPLLIDIPILPQ